MLLVGIFTFASALMTSSVGGAGLECLNLKPLVMWSKACDKQGANAIVDQLCDDFRALLRKISGCTANGRGFIKYDVESGLLVYLDLRKQACASVIHMTTWTQIHHCMDMHIVSCLTKYNGYYSQYEEFLPDEVEHFEFIYNFCKTGPPFQGSALINDNCVKESTNYCWENSIEKADPKKHGTFCDLLEESFKCHQQYVKTNSTYCSGQKGQTIEFIRNMHQLQMPTVCKKEFLYHDGLALPVGMMRYYHFGLVKDTAIVS